MKMLRGITKGVPGSAVEGLAGVLAFYVHRMASTKIAAVQNHPFIAPGGMLVLGHVLKKSRKLGGVGVALIGASGYAAAQVFELRKATQATAPAPVATGTSGFEDYDTGALTQPGDIGALTQASDIGDFAPTAGSAYQDAYGL